jgi:hypothetical protein
MALLSTSQKPELALLAEMRSVAADMLPMLQSMLNIVRRFHLCKMRRIGIPRMTRGLRLKQPSRVMMMT